MSFFKLLVAGVARNTETIKSLVVVVAPVVTIYILDRFVDIESMGHKDCVRMDDATTEALRNGCIVAYMLKDGDICQTIVQPTD